jgi:anti-anti-sigma factor
VPEPIIPPDRIRDAGALKLASTYMASFPPIASPAQERQLASLERVSEDGLLSVRVVPDGNLVVIRLSGELDIASSKKLEDELRRAINTGPSSVVLDLGDVSFIDSTGLRALLLAAKVASTNDTELSMVRASAPVRSAVEVSGLDGSLPLPD